MILLGLGLFQSVEDYGFRGFRALGYRGSLRVAFANLVSGTWGKTVESPMFTRKNRLYLCIYLSIYAYIHREEPYVNLVVPYTSLTEPCISHAVPTAYKLPRRVTGL